MSISGERVQGKPGSPIPLGYGRGLSSGVADFYHADEKLKLRRYTISGITKNFDGTLIVADVTVDIFESDSTRRFLASTVSDADGYYTVDVNGPDTGMTFKAVFYKEGVPDVTGTTVSTLVGVEI